jgi:ssDNA-binding Zn-finger/Zn-ribbon topoisomerase 1
MNTHCPDCRNGPLVPGRLVDHYGLRFVPKGRWLRGAKVQGEACTACGRITLRLADELP